MAYVSSVATCYISSSCSTISALQRGNQGPDMQLPCENVSHMFLGSSTCAGWTTATGGLWERTMDEEGGIASIVHKQVWA